jgi:WD40 repeat protein
MAEERTDSMIRRLDVPVEPDPSFAASSLAALLPRVQAARRQDATRIGRMRRNMRSAIRNRWNGTESERLALVGFVGLLLLLVFASLIALAAATRTTPLGNGALVLSLNGELRAIDMSDGSFRIIGSFGGPAAHVSRSPDGRLVSGWRSARDGDELFVEGLNGAAPRRLVADKHIVWTGCIDQWSPDSRFIATSVTSGGVARILVVDTVTGESTFVTGSEVDATCQVWSHDGHWIAVNEGPANGPHVIAIVHQDGTGLRIISNVGDVDAAGVNSWSPDGTWIYFGGDRSIWRTNVLTGKNVRLTDRRAFSVAPALSPDGSRMAYILDTPTNWDLYVANPDGTEPVRLLQNARNNGWSADGRYVLARWLPPDQPGGLSLVSADGTGFRLVVPAAQSCPDPNQGCDMDWGQPKP